MIRQTLLLLMIILTPFQLWADADTDRKVTLAWEAVEGAKSYDIEIGQAEKPKPLRSETYIQQNRWAILLSPGKYWMRVRARDERGVPSEWGEKSEIIVKLPRVEIIRPSMETTLPALQDRVNVQFEWRPVKGATTYNFYLESEDRKKIENLRLSSNKTQLNLTAVNKYRWYVQAVDETGLPGDREEQLNEFVLEGMALETPQVTAPETIYLRSIDYTKPPSAESVSVRIERFDPNKRDWVTVSEEVRQDTKPIPFPTDWPGGKYQLSMRSLKKYRAPSSSVDVSFEAYDGLRTAELEQRALLRKSLNRTEGWFAQASYVITQVDYSGTHFESGSKPSFKALTGTASAAIARFSEENPWGIEFGGGFGGITLNKRTTFLTSLHAMGLWRHNFLFGAELRASFGLTSRDVPQGTASGNKDNFRIQKFNVLAAKTGLEFWYALDRKTGLQVHSYFSQPVAAKSYEGTPIKNGKTIEFGVMGSYRWRQNITGLAGFTMVGDSYSYPGTNAATQSSGTNTVNLNANYLHLMVEYDY